MGHDPLASFADREGKRAIAERVDRAASRVLDVFEEAGIDLLVLKGPAHAAWLYDESDPRGYADIDILVAPAELARGGAALEAADFALQFDQATDPDLWTEAHAQTWRGNGPTTVDLHWRVPGVELAPEVAWPRLWETRSPLTLAGREAAMLSEVARTVHLATHVAQHAGTSGVALEDLRRGLVRLQPGLWEEAALLSRELDAGDAFAAGLRVLEPEGGELAARLGLPETTLRWTLMSEGAAPFGTVALLRLGEARGLRAKARFALRAAFPPREQMAYHYPHVRGGGRAVPRAYLHHLALLPSRVARAGRALRAARRA
jgi:hypothetical protein